MNGVSLLLAVASLSVVYSWRTGVDQQQEYVLQIEPEIVQSLAAGEEIFSDVPSEAGTFQRICIAILPKDSPATKHGLAAEEQFRQLLISGTRLASRDRSMIAPDAPPTILWPGRPNSTPEQSFGVTTGWQPDASGNQQYIVQIDPTVLSTLSVADELYVPVEAAAGRITRFIVKAGREKLPRVTPQSQAGQTQFGQPPGQSANSAGRGRYQNQTTGGSNWSHAPISDLPRPPSQWSSGFSDGATSDPRTTRFQPSPNPQVTPRGVGFETAPPGYGDPANAARTGTASYPPATDAYGRPYDQTANQRQFGTTYPDGRVAGLPPPPTGYPATNMPGVANPNVLPNNQDRPWGPLLFVTFALFFSIGGNLYLAYTALEFHSRYRNAIERLRSAARSA